MRYSVDLREKALNALKKGLSKKAVTELLGLGKNTLRTWERRQEETGSLEPDKLIRKPRKIDREKLLQYYEENPDATNKEAAAVFGCVPSAIHNAKKNAGITRKKKTKQYNERDEQKRAEFIEALSELPEDSEIYYADESGFDEFYQRDYGYAPRGKEVIGKVSGRKYARENILSALRDNIAVAPFAYKRTTDSALFEGWLECVFVPSLNDVSRSVIIIDNASFHNKGRILDIAEEYGFKVLFLPPYSPDFNPIENFWANVKRRLRQHMREFTSFAEALSFAFCASCNP